MTKVYHPTQLNWYICQHCNQFFTTKIPPSGKKTFCTKRCYFAYKARNFPSIEQVIQLYCIEGKTANTIGREFGVSASSITNLLERNSIPARKAYAHVLTRNPMQGKTHTEEAREKIREANHRQFSTQEARDRHASLQRQAMADGKFDIISKAEKMVAQELDTRGISYTTQHLVRDPKTGQYCACIDIMLANGVAIEVNGTYWHTDPRFYPNGPIHASQKRTAENDARKVQFLSSLGIPLVIIWEHDIKSDTSLAVQKALKGLLFDQIQPQNDAG